MRPDAPTPGKQPFGFPLPAEAFDHFVHPGGIPGLEVAGLDGEVAIACNGFLALRVESFVDLPPAGEELVERVARLPWPRFDHLEHPDDAKKWRPLEDARLALFRGFGAGDRGVRPIWERSRSTYHLRKAPAVRIGAGGVAQLGLVQLCSRLPRAEVWTATDPGEPIFIRFNGGRAILAPCRHLETPRLTVLRPREGGASLRSY